MCVHNARYNVTRTALSVAHFAVSSVLRALPGDAIFYSIALPPVTIQQARAEITNAPV